MSCFMYVQSGGNLGENSRYAGELTFHHGLGITSGPPWKGWGKWLEGSGHLCLDCCFCCKKCMDVSIDGWKKYTNNLSIIFKV